MQWGDAPIHSIAAALFLEPHQVHYFADFGYSHPPFQHCPRNAPDGQLPGSPSLGPGFWQQEQTGGIGCRCDCDPDIGKVPDVCINKLMQPVRPRFDEFRLRKPG